MARVVTLDLEEHPGIRVTVDYQPGEGSYGRIKRDGRTVWTSQACATPADAALAAITELFMRWVFWQPRGY